jgi:hypothetical protein
MRLILFYAFVFMNQQMFKLVSASCKIIASLLSCTVRFICFQAFLLFLQHNRKFKVVSILVYLPRLDIVLRPNGKSGCLSGNSMDYKGETVSRSQMDMKCKICDIRT